MTRRPSRVAAAAAEGDRHYRDVLLEPFAGATDDGDFGGRPQPAVSFWTWRSLYLQGGLSDSEAVEAMATLALTATQPDQSPAPHHHGRPRPAGDVPATGRPTGSTKPERVKAATPCAGRESGAAQQRLRRRADSPDWQGPPPRTDTVF